MRYLLLILLLSCTSPQPAKQVEQPTDEQLMQAQVWLDGCMVSAIVLLSSMGHKEDQINVIALTQMCQDMAIKRMSEEI